MVSSINIIRTTHHCRCYWMLMLLVFIAVAWFPSSWSTTVDAAAAAAAAAAAGTSKQTTSSAAGFCPVRASALSSSSPSPWSESGPPRATGRTGTSTSSPSSSTVVHVASPSSSSANQNGKSSFWFDWDHALEEAVEGYRLHQDYDSRVAATATITTPTFQQRRNTVKKALTAASKAKLKPQQQQLSWSLPSSLQDIFQPFSSSASSVTIQTSNQLKKLPAAVESGSSMFPSWLSPQRLAKATEVAVVPKSSTNLLDGFFSAGPWKSTTSTTSSYPAKTAATTTTAAAAERTMDLINSPLLQSLSSWWDQVIVIQQQQQTKTAATAQLDNRQVGTVEKPLASSWIQSKTKPQQHQATQPVLTLSQALDTLSAQAASTGALVQQGDWASYIDAEGTGLLYYFNLRTGESRWMPPTTTFPVLAVHTRPLAKQGDWAAFLDNQTTGLIYYFNLRTGASQWDRPTIDFPRIAARAVVDDRSIPAPLVEDGDWAAHRDSVGTGLIYYFNSRTGESRWTPPYSHFPMIPSRQQKPDDKQVRRHGRRQREQQRDDKQNQVAIVESTSSTVLTSLLGPFSHYWSSSSSSSNSIDKQSSPIEPKQQSPFSFLGGTGGGGGGWFPSLFHDVNTWTTTAAGGDAKSSTGMIAAATAALHQQQHPEDEFGISTMANWFALAFQQQKQRSLSSTTTTKAATLPSRTKNNNNNNE